MVKLIKQRELIDILKTYRRRIYITMKTTFYFNFDFYQAFRNNKSCKQSEYVN